MTSATNNVYGAVHSMLTLAKAQREAGHEVQFVPFEGKPFIEDLNRLGWKNRPFRVRAKLDPFACLRMARYFRQEKIDVVHAHLSTSSINGCFAAKLARIPSVATVHGMSGKLSFVFADHLIGVSEGVRQHLIQQGVRADRITAVYNGVDLPKDLPSKEEARATFDVPLDATVFGTVARLTPQKGIETSIRAFDLIQKSIPNSVYLLVGDGDSANEYQALTESLGLGDRVRFLGYHSNVFEPLSAMDMFLFPSLKEAMGISVAEALAVGLPVVSTNVGGLPEVITSEVGALVPPNDAEAMAREAIRIATGDREAYSRNARQRAKATFSVESMYRNTNDVYRRLLRLQ
ncbi:MAG: glycosyltransferase family 4 protein [Armatimonadetes bacterium]|nr:glycosyltransferase family 4 protein [Armatimonadota bacterium]